MKNSYSLLIIVLLYSNSIYTKDLNFKDGFKQGYKMGYCKEDRLDPSFDCSVYYPFSVRIPEPQEGKDSYKDGYEIGYNKGMEDYKSDVSQKSNFDWNLIRNILYSLIILWVVVKLLIKLISKGEDELILKEKKNKELKGHKSRIKKDKTNLEKRMVIIEKNLSQFDSIKISKPNEFKNNLIQNEKKIIEKGNTEHLHKFIKISSFLNDLFENLQSSKQDLKGWFSEFYGENGDLFKEKYFDKIKSDKIPLINRDPEAQIRIYKGTASLSDYPAPEFLEKTEKLSKGFVDVFRRETIQLIYLEAIANSMLVFLLDNKQFYFLEILEVFDKLGSLDSSWQKRTSGKLDNIGSKLDLLLTGINELNKSIDTLIDKNDDILQQLKSIDVGISTSVALQSITSYQTFKINMNTKEK